MRQTLIALAALCALVAPAPGRAAEGALDGAAFEALVTGRILSFALEGETYGVEEYFPGRRVVWAFEGGTCRKGSWAELRPGLICFAYEDDPAQHCWRFARAGSGLLATFVGDAGAEASDPGLQPPILATPVEGPMFCPGPEVGV